MVERDTDELAEGLSVKAKSAKTSGALDILVCLDDDTIHAGIVKQATADNHHGETERGSFLNDLEDKVSKSDYDANPGVVKAVVRGWFDDLMAGDTGIDPALRGEIAQEVIEGTQLPVEIHGASDNNTTYNVTLEFRGHTNTIEFDADVMIPGSDPGALQSAFAHQYFHPVEVPDEDWEDIRQYWSEHTELVSVTETTAEGAKADRVLEYLTDSIEPTTNKDELGNSPRTALVDADCDSGPVVWIQDRHFVDEIEAVASVDAKQPICTELRKRDVLCKKSRLYWRPDTTGRDRFWAIEAGRVGIDPDEFGGTDDGEGGVEV